MKSFHQSTWKFESSESVDGNSNFRTTNTSALASSLSLHRHFKALLIFESTKHQQVLIQSTKLLSFAERRKKKYKEYALNETSQFTFEFCWRNITFCQRNSFSHSLQIIYLYVEKRNLFLYWKFRQRVSKRKEKEKTTKKKGEKIKKKIKCRQI